MKEKIIFLTTASLEEDLKDGKELDLGQLKAIFERYGEEETAVYCQEKQVGFDAVKWDKMIITNIYHSDDKASDMLMGYPIIGIEGDHIVLEAAMGPGPQNQVYCTKVKISHY
jgi:hypothetical protein